MTTEAALNARRLGEADARAILDVAQQCDVAEIGEPDTDLDDVLRDLRAPAAHWYGVDDGGGGLSAYAWVAHLPGHLALDGDVRVRPGGDDSLGPPLLDLVRSTAATVDAQRCLHVFVHVDDTTRQAWLGAAGATPVRHFYRMTVDLGDEPPAVVVPPEAEVRPVADREAEKRIVADVVHTAFADHFGHAADEVPSYERFVERTHSVSGFDLGLWRLAYVDDRPAAAMIGRSIGPGVGMVNTLGTLREFRGRGLGRALLLTAFRAMHERGLRRVVLGVDATNPTGAVALYESVGMRSEHSWAVWELPPA